MILTLTEPIWKALIYPGTVAVLEGRFYLFSDIPNSAVAQL